MHLTPFPSLIGRRCLALLCTLLCLTGVKAQLRQIYVDNANASNQVKKISYYSLNEGYVAFVNGIGFTTDSGRTFTKKNITLNNVDYGAYGNINVTFGFGIEGIKAFDRNTLIVYGDYGLIPAILYSTDGANTFKLVYYSQFNPMQLGTPIRDMAFPQNGSIGYAVDYDRILKTTDKGLTWTVSRTDPASHFDDLEYIDDNTLFAFSTQYETPKLLRTTNGGASWQQITVPAGQLRYASFISADKGWVNVMNDAPAKLYYTTNGGASWQQISDMPVISNLEKMRFLNDSTGFATAGFEIYKTTDAGKVWEPLRRDNTFTYLGWGLNDMQFVGTQLWAGGGHGYLELGLQFGGKPLPRAYFDIDTTNFTATGLIHGINRSKPTYSYKWFRDGELIDQSYDLAYTHNGYPLIDTIRLVVSDGAFTDTMVKYQYFNPPVIVSSFQPATGGAGTIVTITGKNLSNANFVSFGGIPASGVTFLSDTSIKAAVGPGASGDVVVATPLSRGSLPGFTFIPPPSITSFSPATGTAGTQITITGTNFTGTTTITFGSTPVVSFNLVSPTEIVAIPASGSSGSITVTTPGGTAISATKFVEIPVITSFTPTHGTSGTIMTIKGTGLNGATAVSVGGTPVREFSVTSSVSITCTLNQGATGNVKVTTPGGTASLGSFTYYLPPVITSFSPAVGPVGSQVVITGSNFIATPSGNTVYFGPVKATITAASTNSLTVTIPAGASCDLISVTTHALTAFSAAPFLVNFSGGGSITASSFAPPANFPTGEGYSNPASIAVGDLDGDGKPDVATANQSGYISICRNIGTPGNISLASKIDYDLGREPNGVWMEDLDGDGRLDLIASVSYDQKISILRNTSVAGTISFDTPVEYASAMWGAEQIVTSDIDADGRPDIILSNYFESTVSVLLNKSEAGQIAFYPKKDFPYGGGNASNVIDMNGDGKPDLISISITNFRMTVAPNTSTNGRIAFGTPLSLPMTYPHGLATADIDGDGKPDIAALEADGNVVSLFRNTSTGALSFDKRIDLPTGQTPVCVNFSDLDGDGQPDMIVACSQDGKLIAYKNVSTPGKISFSPGVDFVTGTYPNTFAIADMDLDGKPDVIATSGNTGIAILRNTVTAQPAVTSFTPTTGINGTTVTILGGNFSDITAVSFGGTPAASFVINSSTSITAVVGNGATGDVTVTNNFGTGALSGFTFGLAPTITSFSPLSGPVGATITINGTNFSPIASDNIVTIGGIKVDVITSTDHSLIAMVPAGMKYAPLTVTIHHSTASSQGAFITLFPGAGPSFNTHSFGTRKDFDGGGNGNTADIDGDGKIDVVYLTAANTVSIYRNTSTPANISLTAAGTVTTGAGPLKQAFGDLDGDGKPEMVTLNYTDNSISILQNTSSPGAISFAPKVDVPSVSYNSGNESDLAIDDLDGDGRPDIVVANYSHILSVFKNTSVNGVFSFTRQDYETGGYPVNITISDLDNDGKKDIAVCASGGGVSVFKNISQPGSISLDTRMDILAGGYPGTHGLTAADADGDGKPDLVFFSGNPINLNVLQNKSTIGSILFATSPKGIPAGDMLSNLGVGDLDGDGKLDFCMHYGLTDMYSGTRFISVVKNTSTAGNPELQPKMDYALKPNISPAGASLADMDGDGRLDLISFGGYISIFRNQTGEPSIFSFTPTTATTGTTVTITGTGFTGTTDVSFGGTPAKSFTVVTDTSITAIVEAGATGDVTVTTPTGVLTLEGFIYVAPPAIPVITVVGPLQFCQYSYDTLRSSSQTGNQWYKDGVALSYTSPAIVVGQSGTYTVTVTANGITSAPSTPIVLTVNPIPAKPVITADAAGLISSATTGNQWYITDTITAIPGATDQRYSPTEAGNYTVIVTEKGCGSRASDPYPFIPLTPPSTTDTSGNAIQIAPNPSSDFIRVTYNIPGVNAVNAEIVNFNGKVVLNIPNVKSGDKINIADLANGLYVLRLITDDGKIRGVRQFAKF